MFLVVNIASFGNQHKPPSSSLTVMVVNSIVDPTYDDTALSQLPILSTNAIIDLFLLLPISAGCYFLSISKINAISRTKFTLKVSIAILGVLYLVDGITLALYLKNLGAGMTAFGLILDLCLSTCQIFLIIAFYKTATLCETNLLVFHQFLLDYRQTPRSKILRRHLPTLDAVVEEESCFE